MKTIFIRYIISAQFSFMYSGNWLLFALQITAFLMQFVLFFIAKLVELYHDFFANFFEVMGI